VRFQKLRLSGFKSFVDPTELAIASGLTGIVGPNGCGKSNLVEALRWVMGESSAKQLRGGANRVRPCRTIGEEHAEHVKRAAAIDEAERACAIRTTVEPAQNAKHRLRASVGEDDPRRAWRKQLLQRLLRDGGALLDVVPGRAQAAWLEDRYNTRAHAALFKPSLRKQRLMRSALVQIRVNNPNDKALPG